MTRDDAFAWTVRNRVHAFYSGHSLSDGVPEAVARIAAARGQTLELEYRSAGYSLLRSRVNGLSPGQPYDAVVVTERHDLPWVAATEGTATHLAEFAKRAWAGNPAADVFFYHTWLAIDVMDPHPWIEYEQRVQQLWECVASRANRDLGEPANRIRVMPGGAALATLVERLWHGQVPGIAEASPSARVRMLFADHVHLTAVGQYFIGLVHYAVLFGQAPAGSRLDGVSAETSAYLERLADEIATAYARVATSASRRNPGECRALAAGLCGASYRLRAPGWRKRLVAPYRAWKCARIYRDPSAPGNPFGD